MPRKYVVVSSTSSSDVSLQYSSEYSRSDSDSADERRNRRVRRRRHDRPPRESKEGSESLHWWLARWLSSEFAKFAISVYEGGKGCIRYLSNTALQALPSARTARELQEEMSRARRSRRQRKRRISPYPGGSGESIKVRKSGKSQRKSRHGRKERPPSPNETRVSLKHRKESKHGHRSPFSVKKQGSSRSRNRRSVEESWIYDENWIENLLKEVKSNFKNPVKVKVYKVTPGEGPCSKSRSDNSQTDSKISISIEELVSPTYPNGNSDVISTSSGRLRSETAGLPEETSVTETRCEKKVLSSNPRHRTSLGSASPRSGAPPRSGSKRLTGEGKMSTLKIPHRTSVSRLSSSDLPGLKDGRSTMRTQSQEGSSSRDSAYCKEGGVFYPAPGKKCTVVCEDVPSNIVVDSQQSVVQNEQQSGLIYQKPIGTDKGIEDSQNLLMLSNDLNDPELDEHKASPKTDVEVVCSGVSEVLPIEGSDASDTPDTPEDEGEMAREEFNIGHRSSCHCSRMLGLKEDDVDNNLAKDDSFLAELAELKLSSTMRSALSDILDSDTMKKPPSDIISCNSDLSPEEQLAPPSSDAEYQQPSWGVREPSLTIDEGNLRTVESQEQNQFVAGSQRLGLSDGQMMKKESKLSLKKSVSNRNGRAPVPTTSSQPPLTHNSNAGFIGNEEIGAEIDKSITIGFPSSNGKMEAFVSSTSVKRLRNIGLMGPQGVSVDQLRKKVTELEHISGSASSVKTTGDDPAMLFLLTVKKGEPTDAVGVEVSGVSMLANNTIGTGGAPFPRSSSNGKTVASCQAPSRLDAKDSEQVGSVTQPLHINPEVPITGSLLPPAKGSKDSSSLTKATVGASKPGSPVCTRSKGILKDSSSSRVRLATSSADGLKPPSKAQLPAEYEAVHPDLVRSSLKELMDVIGDKSLSSPSLKGSSKGSGPNSSKSGELHAAVSSFSVINDPCDDIVVVVSETGKSVESQSAHSSKSTVESAKTIVKSVTSTDASSSKIMVPSTEIATESATTSGPQPGGSQKDLVSIVVSSHYTGSKESGLPNDEVRTLSEGSNFTPRIANEEHDSNHFTHPGPNEPLNQMLSSIPMTASIVASAANAGGASNTDSATEQGSQPSSTFVVDEKESFQAETVSVITNEASVETVRPKEQLAETISLVSEEASKDAVTTNQDSSAVSVPLMSGPASKDGPELHPPGHLTFGEVEKMSFVNSFEATSSQIKVPAHERFKVLERPSTSKPSLPTIKEEVEPENRIKEPSPSPSIVQQRRPSMVSPGLLKRKSRPSTFSSAVSTASTFVDDASDGSFSEYNHPMSAYDRCPCKKVCECCTCGQRGSEKPSFTMSRSISKDRPPMDARSKSFSKPQQSRLGAIDMSSTPVPKNSFDVLRSPFYAHWDYYDLDQDHPLARFVRRPDQAEFDNTDTILMKNVRVGGYTIPYLKLQTKEKVTSKMVCNFYKTRKLPFHGKGKSKENVVDPKDNFVEKSSDSVLDKEKMEKCQCKKAKEKERAEQESIWRDYKRDDGAELLDFPSDLFPGKSKCTQTAEDGCNCIEQPEHPRTVPMPATPCESCDCFISEVELESAPETGIHRPGLSDLSGSEDSSLDKTAVVNEYICGLQELCSNLCMMIGKMRLVIDDTSTSGSTFRSLRSSAQRTSVGPLPRPSLGPLPRPSTEKSPDRESPDREESGSDATLDHIA